MIRALWPLGTGDSTRPLTLEGGDIQGISLGYPVIDAGAHAFLNARFAIARLRLVRQPEAGQRHAGEADAEFLQRPAPRDGLGHSFGQFIEFVGHNFPFVWLFVISYIYLN